MAGRAPLAKLILPGLFTLVGFAILVGLGAWQIERGGAKKRLITRVEQRLQEAPVPLPPEAQWAGLSPKQYEYLRVRLEGEFQHDREFRLHGLLSGKSAAQSTLQGYYILTPLRLADGSTVIVNRGFVPTELGDPARRAEGQVKGRQTIVGLMRAPQSRGLFVPDDDPAKNSWFTRDPVAMAKSAGLARSAPFLIDADATPVPGGWPKGGNTVVSFPDNHLQYAVTWFAIALGLLAVFFAWARQQLKRPDDDPS
ncbi:SURF1 family protein [uncultured Alsobacter sp.]|uniref:SURF1 family protein n=1 Tax=uncultured Alsobacter sp. TaxID=1748258 RepID=UPI0025F52B87|nr:SURF1 family protein [uncultured Alsobacter sp.]